MDNFTLKIIAELDKVLSKRMIKEDLRAFDGKFVIKVIANLNKALSQRALKQSLKELTNLNVNVNAKLNKSSSEAQLKRQIKALQAKIEDLDLRLRANTEQLNSNVKQAANSAQRIADQTPIEYKVMIKKDKLISDLSLLAKQNSKLFTNTAATQKYGKLLDDAYGATTGGDIQELTLRMAAFKSELKATNLSGLTLADTFKKTLGRAGELISATSMVMVAYGQARQAYKEVKELDDSMTGLYKVADEIRSRDDFPAYLDKSIKKAKQLSVETKSLISSVTDWKKIGFGLGLSEELAEVSTKLEKTGDMSIEKATSTLISTLQAFKEIDGFTEDQYSERALAIADKINNISNTRSIDAEGISDALQNSVATLQEGNNDLNQAIAMISAGNKIFQSPSEVGNMLKIVSMRLRGVSEDGEKAEESVAKLRDTILNLTNDKVDIMLDENTFKSTYDILLEISKVYDSLSDKSQALLLEKISGKQRSASTAALLQNMSEAEEIYKDSLNSIGSVDQEFARYQESASAAVTRFKETLVDTYTGVLSGNMIIGVANTGSAILDLANKFNLLQSSIIGIAAVSAVKGIAAIGTACISSAKQMSVLGDAINRVNSLPASGKLRTSELKSIGEATKGLTDKQNKLLLSNKNLAASDRLDILSGQGVIKSKREEKLATLGLVQATDAQTLANTKATASTFSLKTAITGLGASMKAAFMSNPVGISLMALSVTIGAVVGRYQEYRQELEETRQKNIEAAESASAQINKLNELFSQYANLTSITNRTTSQEQEYKKVIEDITIALGDKAKILDGLTVGTQEYTTALKEATKTELEGQYATAVRGRKAAEDNLNETVWSNWTGSQIDVPLNVNMTGIENHIQALELVRGMLEGFERRTGEGINWAPDSYDDMDSVVEYYNALIAAREHLTLQSKELDNDGILDSDIYKNMDKSISKMSDSVESYVKMRYEELKVDYEFHNGVPTTIEGFNNLKNAILNLSGAGERLQQGFNDLLTKDFGSLATQAAQDISTGSQNTVFFDVSNEDNAKVIDDYQSKLNSLSAAIQKVKDQKLTGSELLDLKQEFPELIGETGDLGVALNELVDKTLNQVITYLKTAGASDDFIELFRQIAEESKKVEAAIPVDVFDSIPVDKLEKYVSLLRSGAIDESNISSYDDLNAIMQETGITADEAIQALKEFAEGFTLPSEMISNLQEVSDLISSLEERETLQIDTSSLERIVKLYPEMESALSDYTAGLINEQQLIDDLQSHYDIDLQNYGNYLLAKNQNNLEYANMVGLNSAELVNHFSTDYGIDIGNHTTYAEKKIAIEKQTLQTISDMWSDYYNAQSMSLTDMGKTLEERVLSGEGSPSDIRFYNELMGQARKYKKYVDGLNSISYEGINANFDGIKTAGSGSGKDKKEKEPQTKEFDWIKRRQELLQKLHDQEEQSIDDEVKSYQTRIALINNLIAKDNERLEFNKKAAESYTKVWEEAKAKIMSDAAKQNQDGDAIIASVMNGNTENQTFEGDLADSIQAGVDAYDDYTDGLENSEEIEKEIQAHLKKQLELKIAIAQAQTDILEAEMDALDAEIELMEATGQAVDEGQLKKQLSLSEEIADSYSNQIDVFRDQLDEVEEGSAEYYSIRSQIKQCEAAIADCAVQQAEWNDQIKRLPIEKISRTLEILGFIKEDLQNFIDQQNALGKLTTLPQFQELANINLQQIEELMKQQKLLSDLLDDYEFGSTKYQDTVSELQDIDNEISGLIQSQYDWNKAILQLPIDQLSKAGDVLNNAVTAMSDILADYDSAISAVTGTLDKQIEAINDLKNATTEQYESKIKPLQDELDTLQKQNEARKIQLDLEQAAYDLDKAREQKTNKVIREGEITYEADQDAIRSAESAKNDADYNKVVHDLEAQISGLEEERDKLLEGYDLQIEKLDEIKERWSSITEEIKLAADSLKADDVLGSGWQDKILSGNDADMLNSIKDLYTTISDQKNQYEEQIASNERITDMMNQFMESWQNGSITYDQAISGIKDLANQMKDGYSSLEHLDAIMNLNGATDLGTLLSQMQNSANASVNQFEDYMKVVKENADALEKYNSSWEERQQNIRDQIAALEKLAKEAERVANSYERHSSSGGGGSKGPNTNDKTYVSSGPGHTEAGYNNAIANGMEIREYHKGGIVGGEKTSSDLKSNEVLAKLEMGEQVITHKQREYYDNILQYLYNGNYTPAMMVAPTKNTLPVTKQENRPAEVTINMGDIRLPNVTKVEDFVRDFGRQIDPMLSQAFSKVFR